MSAEGYEMTLFSEDKLMDIMYPFPNSPSPNYCVLPLPKSLQGEKRGFYTIQAIHDGFVLSKSGFPKGMHELYICNPMTNQWFPLPRPKYIPKTYVSFGFITRVEAGILTSYRVVLVRCHRQKQSFVEFEMFCSESGKWVKYTVHCTRTRAVRVCDIKNMVFLNGRDDCELGLIAYDPYTSPDEMRLIDFPKDLYRSYRPVSYVLNFSWCGVHRGLLKYFEVTDPLSAHGFSHLKIWVLEDYDMGRWCLQHMVAFEDITVDCSLCRRPQFVELVCFHPYDADIVYMQRCKDLVSYDMRTRELRPLGLPHEPEKNFNLMCDMRCILFPLLLPAWPICIPTSLMPKL